MNYESKIGESQFKFRNCLKLKMAHKNQKNMKFKQFLRLEKSFKNS